MSEEAISISDLTDSELVMTEWYRHQGLALPICCTILLAVYALSRTLMLLTTRTRRLSESEYFWWQVAEVVVSAAFINLFLSLLLHRSYFLNLPQVLLIYISVVIYPYTFYWLLAERIDRDLRIAEAQRTIMHLRQHTADESPNMVRFADEKGNVRLVVSTESIVSIEAAGNYVNVLYLGQGRLTRYSLRNTLKGIEPLCQNTSLVRCHRSYYLNLNHIRLLRKSPEGITAEIDVPEVPDMPISKSYAADVMARFSETN